MRFLGVPGLAHGICAIEVSYPNLVEVDAIGNGETRVTLPSPPHS